ncbi:MAG TPA: hypothetical protein PK252_11085 [Bacteroidales bacterium]|nr:hypothetical protein [Bacteroidales bacterium]
MKILKIAIILGVITSLTQCKCSHSKAPATLMELDSLHDSISDVSYVLPAPDEMLSDIMSYTMTINPKLANSLENAKRYPDNKSQAINLGVYVADFAYLNLNKNKTNALDYFKTIRELAIKLNVYEFIDESFFDRVQNNLTNNDSLILISRELYFNMSEILENANRNNVFALISAGAIIETIYLSSYSVSNFNDCQAIIYKIFEQKYLLATMFEFVSMYKKDPEFSSIISDLEKIKDILDKGSESDKLATIVKDKENHFKAESSELQYNVDEKLFNELKIAINEVRNNIVTTSK